MILVLVTQLQFSAHAVQLLKLQIVSPKYVSLQFAHISADTTSEVFEPRSRLRMPANVTDSEATMTVR